MDSSLSSDLYRVGLWFWEVDEFPHAWRTAFDHLDEVWVASEFVHDAITPHTKKPVRVFPIPIVADSPTYLRRPDLGIPDGFLFAFCYDAFSVPARKNPAAVVNAFKRAFPLEGEAFLLIKSINGTSGAELDHLRGSAGGRRDIQIVDDYWPRPRMAALMQLCDCYVSLHRSEGFGLTLAAAMAQGKPTIATGYSGNMTFMNESNSLLVPSRLVPVGPGHDPYPPGARWAEPDIEAAAELMRQVRDRPQWAAETGHRGRDSVAKTHGLQRSAEALLGHFDEILVSTLDTRVAS
jgi:glycosyltransferase involved in cell wall biosynthesis